jgi:hypothetical protein
MSTTAAAAATIRTAIAATLDRRSTSPAVATVATPSTAVAARPMPA